MLTALLVYLLVALSLMAPLLLTKAAAATAGIGIKRLSAFYIMAMLFGFLFGCFMLLATPIVALFLF